MESEPPAHVPPDLQHLGKISQLMDNKFALGKFKFGFDPIVGLLPIAGDLTSLLVNGMLIKTISKHGASPWMVMKLAGNQLLDILIGLVPFVGDLADIAHKAHRRNLKLLEEYYADPEPKPPVFWSLILFGIVLLGTLVAGIFAAMRLWRWVAGWF